MSEKLRRLEEARILKTCYGHRHSLGINHSLKEDPTNKCEDLLCIEGCPLVREIARKREALNLGRWKALVTSYSVVGGIFMLILCGTAWAEDDGFVLKQDGLFPGRINIYKKGKPFVLPKAYIEGDKLFDDEYVVRDRNGNRIGTARRDRLFPDRWNFKKERRRHGRRYKHKRSHERRD